MVDIHCHILHQYDDGSGSLSESLEMARMAADTGVTQMVVTPHFKGTASSLRSLSTLVERYRELQQAIARENIPLTLHLGAEILCTEETPRLARQKLLPTISTTHYFLTEFFFDEDPGFMDEMLHDLSKAGYTPVVAHPERYDAIQRDPRILEQWFRRGYVLQLNKGSILGAFSHRAEHTAHSILRAGLAHVIASDAHSATHRTTHMEGLTRWLDRHIDPEYVRILTEENPGRIIRGEPLVPVE